MSATVSYSMMALQYWELSEATRKQNMIGYGKGYLKIEKIDNKTDNQIDNKTDNIISEIKLRRKFWIGWNFHVRYEYVFSAFAEQSLILYGNAANIILLFIRCSYTIQNYSWMLYMLNLSTQII